MIRKILAISILLLISCVSAQQSPYFSGCIVYENEYQTMAGETLYYAVKPKNWFYIQGANFKFYDRNKQLLELYVGAKNELYRFAKGQAVRVADTVARPAAAPRCLPATATILGYRCQAVQLVEGSMSTLIFYAPELRVEALAFRRCTAPGWYALLQATDGALPLRTIMVDAQNDVSVTSEAISVQNMFLADTEFTTTAPAR